jgi:hypothetical protein
MDELDYTDEETSSPDALDPNIRRQLKEAKKARRELDEARAELEAQKRELLFSRAGIPETGLGSLLRKAYDGPADADAIRKAAEEYGIVGVSAAPAEVDNSHAELEALRRAQGATIGTSGAHPNPGQEFYSQLAEAKSPEEVMAIVSGQTGQSLGLWSSRNAR